MRALSGGCLDGTEYADRRRGCHLRHGQSQPSASVAVHPAVRQEAGRSASGSDAIEDKKSARRESTIHFQYGVCPVQAIPER